MVEHFLGKEEVARSIRAVGTKTGIQMTGNDLLMRYWNGSVPIDIGKISEYCGCRLLMTDDFANGCLKGNIIYFPNSCSMQKRRFIVAHLLGHFVNGHGDQVEDVKNFSDQATGIEKIANVFASDILVPRGVLKFLVANGKTNITELAKFFAASEVLVASQIERIFK